MVTWRIRKKAMWQEDTEEEQMLEPDPSVSHGTMRIWGFILSAMGTVFIYHP